MRNLGFLVIFTVFLLLLKLYVLRGIHQVTHSPVVVGIYGVLSIGSLVVGFLIMRSVFSSATVNMSWWPNFITALMLTFVICELILLVFFAADDIVLFFQKLIQNASSEATATLEGRRRFVKTLGLGLTSIPFAAYLYGITGGKYAYKVFRETLRFPDLPSALDGLTIAQFSDFHAGSFDDARQVEQGLALLQKQGADLILFTGDLVNDLAEEVLPYKKFLKDLSAPLGKYAVLGNHDYPGSGRGAEDEQSGRPAKVEQIAQHHTDCGFTLLKNQNAAIERGGARIRLLGVENWGTRFVKYGDLDKTLEGTREDEFSILLSHDPTHWEHEVLPHPRKIHLTLSGHTHGLQMGVDLPGFKWSPIKYVYQRWMGLYREKGQYLYVNRGFGFIGFAGRVGIRPEITVFTLRAG